MNKPCRKKLRLTTYDYEQPGSYFITVCTHKRSHLFIMDHPAYRKNQQSNSITTANRILHYCISECIREFPNIHVDRYIIMPDHIHMIITIREHKPGISIPTIMQHFKTITTNHYIHNVNIGLLPPFHRKIWQKSYYDHVIRNQKDYNETWEYIVYNPEKWIDVHSKSTHNTIIP